MTDHRAEADRQMAERTTYGVPSAEANLLAAIHDLLDARLPTKGEPCPCGCRRDVEPLNPGEAWVEDHDAEPRPEGCCGKCPPLARGGYDCTCKGNPRCINSQRKRPGPDEVVVKRSLIEAILRTRPCAVHDPEECSLCELRAALDAGSES